MRQEKTMASGAFRRGFAISSTMCAAPSAPTSEYCVWRRPMIQATPSGQPVWLMNVAKIQRPSLKVPWAPEQASSVTVTVTAPMMDHCREGGEPVSSEIISVERDANTHEKSRRVERVHQPDAKRID